MSSKSSGAAVLRSAPRSAGYWVSAWWPVAFAIGVILIESTAWLGSDNTSAPLRWLYQALLGPVSDVRWAEIHHHIRKSGHFVGYGLIGIAWLRAWRRTFPRLRFLPDTLLALLGTCALASWDEWHQSLLPNRGSSPWDVLLDCSGAIVMCTLAFLVLHFLFPDRLNRD